MASRRRAAEDKNTKLLRELAALTANKQCFDCLQRGPTYINVTIGSFVCTTCSGILRGLTPPHRVKSISMTIFTPEEIELLKSRGNEYCRYVWLGTYDTNANSLESEVSDDQRKRDFMVQKYEKKRWYVDPDIAVKKLQNDQLTRQKNNTNIQSNITRNPNQIPEVQPLSRLLGRSPTTLVVQSHPRGDNWPHPVSSASAPAISTKTTAQNQGSRSIDLLSELGGDSSVNTQTSTVTSTANGNFANFETAFSSDKTGWTSFDDDLDPLFSAPVSSRTSTLGNHSLSTAMPRPLSLPTITPTNPFKSPPPLSSSQWPSFAANTVSAPVANLPMSASLDAYPIHSSQKAPQDSKLDVFSPPPVSVSKSVQQANADRYAALADLDSLFHQPVSTKAPSWSMDTTSSSGSLFDIPASEKTTFTSASSNPFTSSELWKPVSKSANPFQAVADGGLVYTPFPLVGSSPSDAQNGVAPMWSSSQPLFAPEQHNPFAVTSNNLGFPTTVPRSNPSNPFL